MPRRPPPSRLSSSPPAVATPPACDARVPRRGHGLLERTTAGHVRVIPGAQAWTDGASRLPKLGQVLADAEPASRAGDDNRANIRAASRSERRRETLVGRSIKRVEDVWAAERDREDCALATRLDLGHRQDFRRSTERWAALLAW